MTDKVEYGSCRVAGRYLCSTYRLCLIKIANCLSSGYEKLVKRVSKSYNMLRKGSVVFITLPLHLILITGIYSRHKRKVDKLDQGSEDKQFKPNNWRTLQWVL